MRVLFVCVLSISENGYFNSSAIISPEFLFEFMSVCGLVYVWIHTTILYDQIQNSVCVAVEPKRIVLDI